MAAPSHGEPPSVVAVSPPPATPVPAAPASAPLSLGPKSRLRTRFQLDWMRQHGRKEVPRLCVVSVVAPPPDGGSRVAFVVSRRYSRKAVVRNRARRLLREAYRQLFPALAPAWMVLIPRARLQDARMQEVLADLTVACRRLGLLSTGAGQP